MAKTLFDTKIDIVDLEFPNKGVGYFGEENKKVTVKNTIPGQTVIADVKKKRKNFEGRLRSIEKKAEYEIDPACKKIFFGTLVGGLVLISFTGETGTIKSFIDAIGVYVFASKSPTFGNNNNLGYYDIFKDLSIKKIKADH